MCIEMKWLLLRWYPNTLTCLSQVQSQTSTHECINAFMRVCVQADTHAETLVWLFTLYLNDLPNHLIKLKP